MTNNYLSLIRQIYILCHESSLGSFCISVFISVINDRQFFANLVRKLLKVRKISVRKTIFPRAVSHGDNKNDLMSLIS